MAKSTIDRMNEALNRDPQIGLLTTILPGQAADAHGELAEWMENQ